MAALAIAKQDTMDALVEVASGNNSFTYSYTKTDGTKVEQRLGTGGAAVLLLGKLEAIDYAENLQNRPMVDLNQMVTQIQTVQEPYALSQANYLRVQGYKDPVRQLSEVPIIRQRIAESLRKRRLKLQQLKKSKQRKELINVYVKFIGAGICFVLSLFNVLGAMQRVPVKTTVGDSSRPAVAMMKSPGTNLHWLSGGVFFAASIGLIAWAIWEYNSNIDLGIDSTEAPIAPVIPPIPEIPKLNA